MRSPATNTSEFKRNKSSQIQVYFYFFWGSISDTFEPVVPVPVEQELISRLSLSMSWLSDGVKKIEPSSICALIYKQKKIQRPVRFF